MRRVSQKTAARITECRDFRRELVREVGRCEICGHDPRRVRPGTMRRGLCCHEIARGIHRQKALDKRFATLVVCWRCHELRLSSRAKWPEARQLAALKRSRPREYDLAGYNELVGFGSQRITEEEVKLYARR